jgi:hypothetical protein
VALVALSSCLQIKRKSYEEQEKVAQTGEKKPAQPKKLYQDAEIRSVRKLVADAIDNNFDEESLGKASLKGAMLENPQASALIIDNPQVLSLALDPRLAPIINKKFEQSFSGIIKQFEKAAAAGIIDRKKILQGVRQWKKEGKEGKEKGIKSAIFAIPDSAFHEYDKAITGAITEYNFSDLDQALASIANIPVPDNLGAITDFLRDSFKRYFKDLALVDKRRVLATVIRHTMPGDKIAKQAGAVLLGAGPLLQKQTQKFSDGLAKLPQNSPEIAELKAALDVVKDGLLPNPSYETKRNFVEITRRTNERVSLELVKSLGQATVGVALLVNVREQGKKPYPAVYKELRAKIAEIAGREAEFFRKIAKQHHQQKAFDAKIDQVLEEMNLEKEFDNLVLGTKYYNDSSLTKKYYEDKNSNDLVKAVTRVEEIPRSPHYLTMNLAPGESLKKVLTSTKVPQTEEEKRSEKITLLVVTSLLNELVEKWVMVGFFLGRNGIFHADLHAGNIFVYVDSAWYLQELASLPVEHLNLEHITALMHHPANAARQTLTMIDFGILAKIDKVQREGLLNFLVAVLETHSSEALVQGLEALSPAIEKELSQGNRRESLKQGVDKIFAEATPSSDILAEVATLLAAEELSIPQNFSNFADVMGMLDHNFFLLKERMLQLEFYDESLASLFEFKRILAAVIKAQIGIVPSAHLRAVLRFIPVIKDATAYPDAPTLYYENMKILLKNQIGL